MPRRSASTAGADDGWVASFKNNWRPRIPTCRSRGSMTMRWLLSLIHISFARAHSPHYRELYQRLPERVEDPTLLPVTTKKELMARFDDWVTDRDVTLDKVRADLRWLADVGALSLAGDLVQITPEGRDHAGLLLALF